MNGSVKQSIAIVALAAKAPCGIPMRGLKVVRIAFSVVDATGMRAASRVSSAGGSSKAENARRAGVPALDGPAKPLYFAVETSGLGFNSSGTLPRPFPGRMEAR